MKSKEQIESFKGFCDVIHVLFPKTFLQEVSLDKRDLVENRKRVTLGLDSKTKMIELIGNKQYKYTFVSGENRYVALNIINWLLGD